MSSKYNKLALAAGFSLALAFTLSCHDAGGNEDGTSSSGTGVSSSGGTSGINPSSSGGNRPVSSSSGNTSSSSQGNGSFIDVRDGKKYNTVVIGSQTWMAQNLDYYEEWVVPTRGNRCYNNKDANCEKYGRLYEWGDAIRICPDGWHLPTRAEWNTLVSHIGDDAGKKLKSKKNEWKNGEGDGTDVYGFGALPGGGLGKGEFANLNIDGYWWTSTEYETGYAAYMKYMTANSNGVGESNGGGSDNETSKYQYAVRCVKGYSSSSSITYGEVIDKRDNQKYVTVKIERQTWMAQNLNFAKKGVCYNNKNTICDKFGRLYDWATAMNVSEDYNSTNFNAPPGQHQGICPEGWHLPTNSEWWTMINAVGGSYAARAALKARSAEWGDNYGYDYYGFKALPGGWLRDNEFVAINVYGAWWTTSEYYDKANCITIDYLNPQSEKKEDFYSVRCVED
ncbi:MAG: hypothetical protein FWF63_05525 [Fibromonadales bacterium]|nr:hypothetical protein [Fibromonadales bacterium]